MILWCWSQWRGWGGDDHYLCIPGLDLSLFSPPVQPSPVLPNNKYGNTHHSSHNNTWSDNNTATAVLKYVWQHESWHVSVCSCCYSSPVHVNKRSNACKVEDKGDPVSNVILVLPCLTTISHCSKLNVLKPSSFQECLKVDIIGK